MLSLDLRILSYCNNDHISKTELNVTLITRACVQEHLLGHVIYVGMIQTKI